MREQLRSDDYRKIAADFLRRAKNARTEAEREDFLDMARAITLAARASTGTEDEQAR
jgi:hypothetical protein